MNESIKTSHRLFGKSKLKMSLIAICVASSFSSISAANEEILWSEDFNDAELNDKGAINDSIDMSNITRWTINVSNASLTADTDWFKVTSGLLEARDVDGEVEWLSENISIQNKENITVSLNASEVGTHESADYLDVAYAIDNEEFVQVNNWQGLGNNEHTLIDDFTSTTIIQGIPTGNNVQIKITMANNAGSEKIRIDDILVTASGSDSDTDNDSNIIKNACFNCPDLSTITNAEDFNDLSYYESVYDALNSEQDIDTIRTTINDAISNNHQQLSYSQAWTALTVTDEDPTNPENVILFYRGISKDKFSNGSGTQSTDQDNWNREHVWAKSHGFPSANALAYSDIHHLRPTDISVNASRGNLDFDNSDNALTESPENRYDANSFEPRDAVKGDVARIVMYMDIRYAGLDSITPDLQVVDSITTTGEAKLGKLCTLLEWSEADPVDDFEQNRNDKIYEFQGNRNPFIDHPEWISVIYGESCDGSPIVEPTDPVEPDPTSADLFFSEYIEGSSFNKAVEIYNPTNTTISLENYQFNLYSNGSTSITSSYNLTGELIPGDVVVLGSSQISDDSNLITYIDHFVSAVNFNGDDYIELVRGDTIIDNIGTYGVKESWGKDKTLVRLSTVTQGNTVRDSNFTIDNEWQLEAQDTFNLLGVHLSNTVPSEPVDNILIGQCNDEADFINVIQGDSQTSPVIDEIKVIEGVVTSVVDELDGYFVQEEITDIDNDPMTSEGIFVYHSDILLTPTVGHKIRVIGAVKEQYNRTQLSASADFLDCGESAPISPLLITMPVNSSDYWETIEGMTVSFSDTLKVADTYNLARYGQLTLSSSRLLIPTNIYIPGSEEAINLANENNRNRIMLDDINNTQNPETVPFPAPSLSYENPLRLGDSISNLTGVIDYSFSEYRILPTQTPQFSASNVRPTTLEIQSGSLKVASFNVLNYFNGDGFGEGFPTSRGADSYEEFIRQTSKIVSALATIDADIVGLMEIENDGFDENSAIATLVAELNTLLGENAYQYVSLDQASLGGDEITVGFIFKPSTVALLGTAMTTAQVPFDYGNRQPLVQTFTEIATNEALTIAVNHFKSKGSCSSATDNNLDLGDGQSCWNELRTQAANTLTTWLSTQPTGTEDADILIIGDLNAYGKEDPINTITSAGYHDLIAKYNGTTSYSYSYDGELGYLDHALANNDLATQVVDTAIWHVNADEPRIFDYNTEYKSTAQLSSYFSDEAYRASDHDPIIISLNLSSQETIVGDFDGDNDVDINDVRQFSLMFRSGEAEDINYDFNQDNQITTSDVRALMMLCTRSRCAAEQ